jgi:hypothetical protein
MRVIIIEIKKAVVECHHSNREGRYGGKSNGLAVPCIDSMRRDLVLGKSFRAQFFSINWHLFYKVNTKIKT